MPCPRSTNDRDVNNRLTASVTNPFKGIIPSTTTLGSGATTSVAQLLRPYPEFTDVTAYTTTGMSIYHALLAQLNRRFTNGASLTTAFTWSKSLDATQYLNNSDARPWYGVSANDRTFRFATSGIYQLPFGTGRRFLANRSFLSTVVGGFQVQGVYQVQTGAPLSFSPASSSPVYNGTNPVDSAWGRAAYKRTAPPGTAGLWFNTANWLRTPATSQTGVSGVDTTQLPNAYQIRTFPIRFDGLRSDFLNQFDAAFQRNFALSRVYEPLSLQVRVDAINVLNHPVYGSNGTNSNPVTDWTSATFAQVTAQSNQPRIYQFEAFIRF